MCSGGSGVCGSGGCFSSSGSMGTDFYEELMRDVLILDERYVDNFVKNVKRNARNELALAYDEPSHDEEFILNFLTDFFVKEEERQC